MEDTTRSVNSRQLASDRSSRDWIIFLVVKDLYSLLSMSRVKSPFYHTQLQKSEARNFDRASYRWPNPKKELA